MDSTIFHRIREGLEEKRDNLRTWMQTTPEEIKINRLGSQDEVAVENYLQHLAQTIEAATEENLGVCQVCHEYVETELIEMDYTACVCLDHLSIPERRELEHELELAQSVQKTLLPQVVPTIPGLEIAAFSRPAQYVGGDYFDFFEFQGNSSGLAVADVAGHGVSASLHMASVQTLLRTFVPTSVSPAEVVGRIQNLFSHNIRFNTFVTLLLGSFDSEKRILTYCNAGHNPPIVTRQAGNGAGRVEWLQPTGPAIGLLEEADFRNRTVSLKSGDILVFYTDGITEARNSEDVEFGQERLADLISQESRLSPKDLVKEVKASLDQFVENQPLLDDTTLVVCKVE
jgi:phosphoserine phosphatase RsbU/P